MWGRISRKLTNEEFLLTAIHQVRARLFVQPPDVIFSGQRFVLKTPSPWVWVVTLDSVLCRCSAASADVSEDLRDSGAMCRRAHLGNQS